MFLLICMHVFIHLFIQSGWIVSSVSKKKRILIPRKKEITKMGR